LPLQCYQWLSTHSAAFAAMPLTSLQHLPQPNVNNLLD
jgi:hypothetical protein